MDKDNKLIKDRIKALKMILEKDISPKDWEKKEIDTQIEFEALSEFEGKLDEVEDVSGNYYVDKAFADEDKEDEFFEEIKELSDTINNKKSRYQKQKLENYNKGIYAEGGAIKWQKNIHNIHGWKMSPYEFEGGYISENGNWKIFRNGSWRYDKWRNEDIFIRDGYWRVEGNKDFKGEFDTLKEAKQYVERWININPDDFEKGGNIPKGHTKVLETEDFSYYSDENGEYIIMIDKSDGSLASDNYFAENDLYERMVEIANGREKYIYINPESKEYLKEYIEDFEKGGRVSPNESATAFEIGTIKTGNDGNDWIIKADKNGRQSWRKHAESVISEDGIKITDYVDDTSSNWGNFFENNPDKVLGISTKVKTKFGKEAVVIKKTDDLSIDLIDVPNYNIKLPTDFSQSESPQKLSTNTITEKNVIEGKNALDEDDETISMIEEAVLSGEDLDKVLYSFDEVDKEYNGVRKDKAGNIIAEAISDIAKCAYVFYIEKLHDKKIEGGFSKYANLYTEQQLLNQGELFYDYSEQDNNRKYQPKFLFESGNITDKKIAFDNNKADYEKRFGKANAAIAESVLSSAFKIVNERRLTLDNVDVAMRLKISLISKEAKTFKIKGINNPYEGKYEKGFKVYAKKDKSQNIKSFRSDLHLAPSSSYKNNHTFEELSLSDAFFYWLRVADWKAEEAGIRYNDGVTLKQILDIYYRNAKRTKTHMPSVESGKEKERWIELKGEVRRNGDRLFSTFLATALDTSDRRLLEHEWNRRLNSHVDYDVNKVPIGFRFTRFFGNSIRNDIRSEKRDAIAFYMLRGSCLFAYGVGVGKTWCSIFTIAQVMDMGIAKRPLIVVPKQVYAQFAKEITTILGTDMYKLNKLYNCSENIDMETRMTWHAKASSITDKSISICTYYGMQQYGFSPNFDSTLLQNISEILTEGDKNMTPRQKAIQLEKHEELLGIGTKGTTIEIDNESVNFDFICFDEAHNAKKVFTDIKGDILSDQTNKSGKDEGEESETAKREKTGYDNSGGGAPSTIGIKLFFLTQFIQSKTTQGNTLLMTATPFTNSPVEVFSMLALINHKYLKKVGFYSVKSFYDVFADMQVKRVMTSSLNVAKRPVFVGWKNLIAMQDVVHSLIDKKGRAEEDKLVDRPTKIILPFRSVMKNGTNYPVSKKNRISTTLEMNDEQKQLRKRLLDYVNLVEDPITNMAMTKAQLCGENMNTTKFGKMWQKMQKKKEDEEFTLDSDKIDDEKEKVGVRSLECLTYFRHFTINPYLYSCSGYTENPTPSEFVEASPKMLYVVECIKSVHAYEKKHKLPMSGQVIYMGDIGVEHGFPLLAKYLVEELGLKEHEVGMISGSQASTRIGKTKLTKDGVQDAFLGRKFNESTTEFETINDSQRCKILIGSSSIREGMNLQFHASCLYNLYLDFNPTDITQLEGRIWRQGNKFDNVRIITPLLEDSMDIFMFQKLEEKTERINQIWNRDGKTNELNTEDFDPNELKEILVSSIEDLAALQAEDATDQLNDKIESLNRNYVRYRNLLKEYESVDSFYEFDMVDIKNTTDRIPAMYHFLRAFRPDLVPLDLIKSSLKDKWWNDNNDVSNIRHKRVKDEFLNYTLKDLIDKMVQMHKDKKIAYPENYTSDWRELLKDDNRAFEIGDKVDFETKRGKKKKGVVIDIFTHWKEANIQVGSDEDNIFEDIHWDNMKLITDKSKEKKKEKLTPFTWGTKEWKEKIMDISDFQVSSQGNPLANTHQGFGRRWDRKYDNSTYHHKVISDTFDTSPKDYGYNTQIIDYFGRMLEENLLKMDKWIDFQNYMREGGGSKRWGYNTSDTYSSSGLDDAFWNYEYPLIFKKLEKAETQVLAPLGIFNREQLDEKIATLNAEISVLNTEKDEVGDKGNLELRVEAIRQRIEKEKKEGIRTSSTYKNRAKEFGDSNPDYAGNNFLDILAMDYLLDTTTSVEDLRETMKYQELTIKEKKKFENKLKKRLNNKTAEVIEVKEKPKSKKEDIIQDKAIQKLEDRIKAFSMGLTFLKGKEKKRIKDTIKGLNMILDYKKG